MWQGGAYPKSGDADCVPSSWHHPTLRLELPAALPIILASSCPSLGKEASSWSHHDRFQLGLVKSRILGIVSGRSLPGGPIILATRMIILIVSSMPAHGPARVGPRGQSEWTVRASQGSQGPAGVSPGASQGGPQVPAGVGPRGKPEWAQRTCCSSLQGLAGGGPGAHSGRPC